MTCRKNRRRAGGFTLLEVLLVMAILLILASFVTVNIVQKQKKARIDQAKAQIGFFDTPLKMFQMDILSFPTTSQGLQALRSMPSGLTNSNKWQGPYLDKDIPMDPWGRAYQYASPGTHNPDGYDLWTVGEDGAEIGNWNLHE